MSMTLYEQMGYKALKLLSPDQMERWIIFLQHNKQVKEADTFDRLIADFVKAKQELQYEKWIAENCNPLEKALDY